MLYTSKSGLQNWRAIAAPDGSMPIYFAWGYGVGLVVDPRYHCVDLPMSDAGRHCRERVRHIDEVVALLPGGGLIQDRNGCLSVWVRRDQLVIAVRSFHDVIIGLVDLRPLRGTALVRIGQLPYTQSDQVIYDLVAESCALTDAELEPPTVEVAEEIELPPKAEGGEDRPRREWTVGGQRYILPRDAVLGVSGDTACAGISEMRSAAIFDDCSARQIASISAAIDCGEIEKYEEQAELSEMSTPEVVSRAHKTRDAFLNARAAESLPLQGTSK